MSLKRRQHNNFQEVSSDLFSLDGSKEDKITFADRAPNSSDNGRIWINYAGASGSRWYFKHPITGTWTTP